MDLPVEQRRQTPWRRRMRCWLPAVCLLLSGCLDSEAMIDARRKIANLVRLEEVDLGEYRLTLSQPVQSTAMAEIQFHAFGQVANQDLKKVTKAIEDHGPELRHRLLLAARELELKDLAEANLILLRSHLTKVANETLADEKLPSEPLQSIGFYKFEYYDF